MEFLKIQNSNHLKIGISNVSKTKFQVPLFLYGKTDSRLSSGLMSSSMLRPKVVKDLFMFPASVALSPVEPDRLIFSLPAKSKRFSFSLLVSRIPLSWSTSISTVMQNIEWDRLDSAFIRVIAAFRLFDPWANRRYA